MEAAVQSKHKIHSVDSRTLRRVCGLFVTGVTVITTGVGENAAGTTVNSFTSVSLDPPLVLFCIHRDSRLRPQLRESGRFAVNLLTRRQEQIARAFAGRQTASFDHVVYRESAGEVPVLGDALAYLACDIVAEYPGGDHMIVVGEVVELGLPQRRQEPLIFFEGSFGALEEELRTVYSIWDG
jgi:3-hydroxy-9,10-secoandrosta-1,3,5(10)-triene-9,17-dione monooxygenase reductase component